MRMPINHVLDHDDIVDSIKVNDDVIYCTNADDASTACHNILLKQKTYSNNNNDNNMICIVPDDNDYSHIDRRMSHNNINNNHY